MKVSVLIDLYEVEGCFVQRGIRQGEAMKERTKAYTIARLKHHVGSAPGPQTRFGDRRRRDRAVRP